MRKCFIKNIRNSVTNLRSLNEICSAAEIYKAKFDTVLNTKDNTT